MLEPDSHEYLWLVIVGFIIAFVLAFGIGANDVANSFGTSVGAKVLTLYQACVIASIFELAGAVLIGRKVSDTVRNGIIDMNNFNGTEELAMAGSFSALTGTSIWLLVATFFNLPVSGTHSIVGATIGYGLVAIGADGVTWETFGKIAASWVISPLLSGLVSCFIFFGIDRLVLKAKSPLNNGLFALPFLLGATLFVNFFSILDGSKEVIGIQSLEVYQILLICAGASIVLSILCYFFVNPFLRRKILGSMEIESSSARFDNMENDEGNVQIEQNDGKSLDDKVVHSDKELLFPTNYGYDSYHGKDEDIGGDTKTDNYKEINGGVEYKDDITSSTGSHSPSDNANKSDVTSTRKLERKLTVLSNMLEPDNIERMKIQDDPHSSQLFKYLQILTASFGSFAHGGNDVSNAIGPLISLWIIYHTGEVKGGDTPIWILIYGGVGIIVGLCVWGRRVIKTIGENLSPITPSSGFSIEIGAALTVLLASYLSIPVSTTHCKVGSVVFVGRLRSKEVVNWKLFGNIVISWVVTMPVTGGIAAAVFAILREVL